MPSLRLSVVVPAYNEAAILEQHLLQLAEHLQSRAETFEILCVDDGSRDDTAAILSRLGPPIRALTHPMNRGKGAAVRTGALDAHGERVIFLDADLSTDLAGLTPLLAALDSGADIALGSRRVTGAQIARHQPPAREFMGRVFSGLARTLIAPQVRDFTCGFKGFRREAAQAIFSRTRVDRWAFDAEVIAIARARGMNLIQIPVHWQHAGGSKVRVFGAVFGSLFELCAIVVRRGFGTYRR